VGRSRERSRPSFSPGRERLDNCRLRLWRQFTPPRKPSAAFFAPIRTSLSSLPTTTYNKKDGDRGRKARARQRMANRQWLLPSAESIVPAATEGRQSRWGSYHVLQQPEYLLWRRVAAITF